MDVVSEPIEQRAGQPLGCEHAGPLVERQVIPTSPGPILMIANSDRGIISGGSSRCWSFKEGKFLA
jgi:hypothetical protein